MAFQYFDTSNGNSIISVVSTDTLVISEGVILANEFNLMEANTAGTGGLLSDVNLYVLGTALGDQTAIEFSTAATSAQDIEIFVGAEGSVLGANSAVSVADVDGLSITNNGEMHGNNYGLFILDVNGQFLLNNAGTISSNTQSAISTEDGFGILRINNSGVISSDGDPTSYTIDTKVALNLNNTGDILGATGSAVLTDGSNDDRIGNSGTIGGDIDLHLGNDTVVNRGTIDGNLTLNSGDDLYEGGSNGAITGVAFGGNGNDTLRGSDAAEKFNGGNDNDVLSGRGGDDELVAGNGDDVVLGGDGNDVISAEVGADTVNGNAGDDTIDGGLDADVLRGGRDDDLIRGGSGADTLRGDSGDDLIIGGADRDDMFGGSGNDVFLFETLSDSGTGAARDRIYDFRAGEDTVDISQLTGPAISYIGSANFSGSGGREVRTVEVTNGTLVYIDTNGDGNRDSDIYLIGTFGVTEGDFLL